MRIHLVGSFLGLDPVVLIFTVPGSYTFDKTLYPDHTIYDIMVVGGGAGYGGGLSGTDPDHPSRTIYNFGGAGGGGGSHRLQGLLEILDDSSDITVGAAGANGDDGVDDPDASTDGEDGTSSIFAGFIAATGGKGGKRAQTLSSDENSFADGGDGGRGGVGSPAGGGAIGGICGFNNDPEKIPEGQHTPGVNGLDGLLWLADNGWLGQGGGGGAGGSIRHDTDDSEFPWQLVQPLPTNGGRGSYNSDELVYSPYGLPQLVTPSGAPSAFKAKPGRAGGARVTPFNRSNATFGDTGKDGVVIIKLFAA